MTAATNFIVAWLASVLVGVLVPWWLCPAAAFMTGFILGFVLNMFNPPD
jgi:uncharacterized membrane protein (Fun14 family)